MNLNMPPNCVIKLKNLKNTNKFDYVSLIPCTEKVTGVYTLGLKYELNGRDLLKSSSLGISNEFYNNTAKVRIESGLLYVICTQE